MVDRRYIIWKGKNTFILNGIVMFGSQPDQLLISMLLMVVTWAVFCFAILSYAHSVFLNQICLVLVLLNVSLALITVTTDPGIYIRQCVDAEPVIYRDDLQKHFGEQYCSICRIVRRERARHCRICDNCVDVFDHHCPWLGTCIGVRNYVPFFLFLCSIVVAVLWMLATIGGLMRKWIIASRSHFFPVLTWSFLPWAHRFAVIALAIWLLMTLALVGTLLILHSYLVVVRKTTGEFVRERRDRTLQQKRDVPKSNPQVADHGTPGTDPTHSQNGALKVTQVINRGLSGTNSGFVVEPAVERLMISALRSSSNGALGFCGPSCANCRGRDESDKEGEKRVDRRENQDRVEDGERDDMLETSSFATVSSLSFKSASFQEPDPPSTLACGNMIGLATKNLSTISFCLLQPASTTPPSTTTPPAKQEGYDWQRLHSMDDPAEKDRPGVRDHPSWNQETRLLPMWQYPDFDDDRIQRSLAENLIEKLRQLNDDERHSSSGTTLQSPCTVNKLETTPNAPHSHSHSVPTSPFQRNQSQLPRSPLRSPTSSMSASDYRFTNRATTV